MTTITAQKRDMKVKAKRLRREGFVPGIVCGKEMGDKMTIQIPEKEAMQLIRNSQKGEQVLLTVGDQKLHTIIKDFTYNAMTKQLEVLDFQALVKGEKIHTAVEVILKNETVAEGIVTQELSEIPYKADSDHLIDTIVIDIAQMRGVKTLHVGDLEVFKDPNVTISNPNAIIYSITEAKGAVEDDTEETEEA